MSEGFRVLGGAVLSHSSLDPDSRTARIRAQRRSWGGVSFPHAGLRRGDGATGKGRTPADGRRGRGFGPAVRASGVQPSGRRGDAGSNPPRVVASGSHARRARPDRRSVDGDRLRDVGLAGPRRKPSRVTSASPLDRNSNRLAYPHGEWSAQTQWLGIAAKCGRRLRGGSQADRRGGTREGDFTRAE